VGAAGHYSNRSQQLIHLQRLANLTPDNHSPTESPAPKRHQRHLKGQEIQQPARAYQEGGTVNELAKRNGIHRQTVSALLEREGLTTLSWYRLSSDLLASCNP